MKTIIFFIFLIINLKLLKANFCYNKDNFNHLVLNLQWPTTFVHHNLRGSGDRDALEEHKNKNELIFTIHGLWPQKTNSHGPTNCVHPDTFNLDKIKPIKKIDKYWTSFGMPTSNFWRYEWTKHGTCAAVLENLTTIEEYFNFAVKKAELFDTNVFQNFKGEFKPSLNSYRMESIKTSIDRLNGFKTQMKCWGRYVSSIQLCFDLELKLQDCDDFYHPKCNGDIILPSS